MLVLNTCICVVLNDNPIIPVTRMNCTPTVTVSVAINKQKLLEITFNFN